MPRRTLAPAGLARAALLTFAAASLGSVACDGGSPGVLYGIPPPVGGATGAGGITSSGGTTVAAGGTGGSGGARSPSDAAPDVESSPVDAARSNDKR